MKDGTAYDWASGGHINATLWEATDNSTNLSYWVEIGYTRGWEGSNILTWYWADNRPNGGGYYQHKINTPGITAGTWHHLKVRYTGNNTWTVYIDGSQPNNGGGISTSNPPDSNSMEAGLESTSECSNMGSSSNYGQSDSLNYYSGGSWTSQWPSSTTLYQPGPAVSQWITTYQDVKYWL